MYEARVALQTRRRLRQDVAWSGRAQALRRAIGGGGETRVMRRQAPRAGWHHRPWAAGAARGSAGPCQAQAVTVTLSQTTFPGTGLCVWYGSGNTRTLLRTHAPGRNACEPSAHCPFSRRTAQAPRAQQARASQRGRRKRTVRVRALGRSRTHIALPWTAGLGQENGLY